MKKIVLTFIAMGTMFMAFSQTSFPCVKAYSTGNLGGGDCPTTGSGNNKYYPGYDTVPSNSSYFPTGKVTVFFQSAIPAGTAAPIITAAGVDDGSGHMQLPPFDYKYRPYNDNISVPRTSVVYCYYGSASNQNIFNGSKAPKLVFKIIYSSNPDQTCGGVVEQSTLPVLFKSFTATRNDNTVSIKWETATEFNNRGFYVQRNVNGEWKDIAFVFSKADDGNSSQVLSYAYNDPNGFKAASYYRILQVDLEGGAKYSETRIVKGPNEVRKLMMFPNPGTNGKINVLFDDEAASKNVIVYDATGRAIKSFKNLVGANLTIDQLKPGMYNIQVINTTSQTISSDKFIIRD